MVYKQYKVFRYTNLQILVLSNIYRSGVLSGKHKLSWLGRVAAVMMVLVPKLIFVFLNAILDISDVTLNKIQIIINKMYLE